MTQFGKEQCRKLSLTFPHHERIDLIVASPLRRTIFTALLSFPKELENGLSVIALSEAQETSASPCDTGSDVEALQEEFADQPVDLDLVTSGWHTKEGKWAPDEASIAIRAKEVRRWLRARPEKEIVLVTHGGFLHYLTEDWTDHDPIAGKPLSLTGTFWIFQSIKLQDRWELIMHSMAGTGWDNTEFRSYEFGEESEENVPLLETSESRTRRAGTTKPLSGTEMMELKETAPKALKDCDTSTSVHSPA